MVFVGDRSMVTSRCLGCDTHQTVALDITATEDDADRRAGALHAVQGLFGGARPSVQAELSDGAPAERDFGERSAVALVAG